MAAEAPAVAKGEPLEKAPKPSWRERLTAVKLFIIKNYLPIAFLVALTFALAYPVPGRFLSNVTVLSNVKIIQMACIVVVFFITGLQINTEQIKRALALRFLPSLAYGIVAILVITPCLGFVMREIPLDPYAFSTGLTVFCVAPTTLGVGVALTQACGGNDAVALLLTVVTNCLAVVTMPPELRLLLPHGVAGPAQPASPPPPPGALPDDGDGGGSGSSESNSGGVQVLDLLVKLAITVLIPVFVGKALREGWPAAKKAATTYKVHLSLTSTTCLAAVVWMTLSSARDTLVAQQAGPVFAMMGLAIGMHLLYLVGNYIVVWYILRPPLKEAIAVGIMASQKSAPVAVTVIAYLAHDPVTQGLMSLPGIIGQLFQIFIGAAIAKWLSGVVKRADREAAEKAAAEKRAAADAAAAAAEEGAAGREPGATSPTGGDAEPGKGSSALAASSPGDGAANKESVPAVADPLPGSVSARQGSSGGGSGGAHQTDAERAARAGG